RVLSLLPLRVLYLKSDFVYFLVYKIFRYRVKVVRENLKNAFPDKDEKFLLTTERKFYRHLCDIFIEAFFMWSASPKKMRKHLTYNNLDVFSQLHSRGKDIIILFGHCCNWEFNAFVPQELPQDLYEVGTLFQHLHDKNFDKIVLEIRERFGVKCVTQRGVLRKIVENRKQDKRFALAFIADQSPSRKSVHYWTTFLNQQTTFITGWEEIARKFDCAVIYVDMQKKSRGKYVYAPEILCENPKDLPQYALTEMYARRLEQNILLEPAHWLWSHKRWKIKPVVNG
ncbi:MAG: lysophospholipid acyltransferase family protein, partial [Prevotellaceae bacterium]|nr:lysophospholipid acyltransferase family protein [Prevotellaceae bacterium]